MRLKPTDLRILTDRSQNEAVQPSSYETVVAIVAGKLTANC